MLGLGLTLRQSALAILSSDALTALILTGVSPSFALRLSSAMLDFISPHAVKGSLRVWFVTFLFVRLQMTTALRPIVDRANTFLPTKKLFFLANWGQNLSGEAGRSE